jgi:hypothetical protein
MGFSDSKGLEEENALPWGYHVRTMVLWPEGHGLRSSVDGYGYSVSLESLGEMNGEMNFTSLDGLCLG